METIRYALIGDQDIRFGEGTYEVTLADGRQVLLSEVDINNKLTKFKQNVDGNDKNLTNLAVLAVGTTSTSYPLYATDEDARTNTVKVVLVVGATTTGTPAAGIGSSIQLEAESADEAPSILAEIQGLFTDINAGSEDSVLAIKLRAAGATVAEFFRFTAAPALGIGTTTPAASAIVDLTSTTQGFLRPRMTTTQRNAIGSPATGLEVYNTTTKRVEWYDGSGWVAPALVMPRSYLAGLGLSNNGVDATNDIDLAVGACRDGANGEDMVLASALTKQLDAAWSVGTNAGGLDTGVKTISTWYHLWLIKRTDTGVVDMLFSASATAPTMPTNYDTKRRLGSIRTDAANIIMPFYQWGPRWLWKTVPALDVDVTTLSTVATNYVVMVPTGVVVEAFLHARAGSGGAVRTVYLYSPNITDQAVSLTATPLATVGPPNTSQIVIGGQIWIVTDTSAQVRAVSDGASTTLKIATLGWTDWRGREG